MRLRLNEEALNGAFRLTGAILLALAVVFAVIGWGGAHRPEFDALHRELFYSMAEQAVLGGAALLLLSYCEFGKESPGRITWR